MSRLKRDGGSDVGGLARDGGLAHIERAHQRYPLSSTVGLPAASISSYFNAPLVSLASLKRAVLVVAIVVSPLDLLHEVVRAVSRHAQDGGLTPPRYAAGDKGTSLPRA